MGTLYTWGRGSNGQLGHSFRCPKASENSALPYPVEKMRGIVVTQVACGGGQQGCTGAVTSHGKLYVFGNNYGGRLGFVGDHVSVPTELKVGEQAVKCERSSRALSPPPYCTDLISLPPQLWLWDLATDLQ